MSRTTTKNPISIPWVERVEILIREHNDERSAAAELLNAREAERTRLMDAADSLRDRLRAGDDSVPAVELVTSLAELEKADLLVSHADKLLTRLERTRPVRPELAAVVSEALSSVLRVPVRIEERPPVEVTEALPSAVLTQVDPTEHDEHSGHLAGSLAMSYVRSDLHAAIDAEVLEAKLRAAGVGVAVNGRGTVSLAPGVECQALQLSIASVWPEVPVIAGAASPAAFRLNSIPVVLTTSLEDESRVDGKATIAARATLAVRSAEITGLTRKVTIAVDVTAWAVHRMWNTNEVLDRVRRSAIELEGRCFAGVGRVRSVRVEGAGPADAGKVGAVILLEVVSQTPAQ